MKKHLIIFTLLLFVCAVLQAQNTHFTTNGTIEFERTINMYALIKKQINKDNEIYMQPAFDGYRKNNGQFKKQKSTITFSKDRVLFTPIPDDVTPGNNFFWGAAPTILQNNVVFTDLLTNISTTQKKVFEETFLIKDTTRKITWKITDETREIAGYTCRRANAIIMDSVYVVAFYTDEIPVSGGPESFCGLPGMILGVALPHDSMTWFATKVTDTATLPNTVTPPTKGKPVDKKQLRTKLDAALKNWGSEGRSYLKALLL